MRVQANGRSLRLTEREIITAGSAGMQLYIDKSAEWDDLGVTAVFKGSGIVKDRSVTSDHVEIPPECITAEGDVLTIGLYGTDGTKVIIPTVWCIAGVILEATAPSGDTSTIDVISHYDEIIANVQRALTEIRNEAAARAEADQDIIGQMPPDLTDAVISIEHEVDDLIDKLNDEIVRAKAAELTEREQRTAADNNLAAEIASEANARQSADRELDSRVTYLEQHGGGGSSDVTKAYVDAQDTAERTARESADSALDSRVTDLENRPLTSGVSDVTLNGTSVVSDGVAAIPIADKKLGAVKIDNYYGLSVNTTGLLIPSIASDTQIKNRSAYRFIGAENADKMILASLTDGKSASLWTEDKQAAARALLGIGGGGGSVPEWQEVGTITLTEETGTIELSEGINSDELMIVGELTVPETKTAPQYISIYIKDERGTWLNFNTSASDTNYAKKRYFYFNCEKMANVSIKYRTILTQYDTGNNANIPNTYFVNGVTSNWVKNSTSKITGVKLVANFGNASYTLGGVGSVFKIGAKQ